MNDYRITDKLGDITVTAIDEKAARRTFKNFRKCSDAEIITITLIRENTCATKQQEREALERIRAILAPLGPRSYCRTAFEGCLEDAEANIDDDAAYSMKARYEEAQKKLRQEIAEHQATRKELQQARQALRDAENNATWLSGQLTEAQKKVITADDITDVGQLIDGYISRLQDMVKAAEAAILDNAEHPETATFCDAVRERKNLTKDIEYYKALAARIAALGKQ